MYMCTYVFFATVLGRGPGESLIFEAALLVTVAFGLWLDNFQTSAQAKPARGRIFQQLSFR